MIYDSRDVFKTMEESRKGIEAQKKIKRGDKSFPVVPPGNVLRLLVSSLDLFCASIPLRDSSIVLNTSPESYIYMSHKNKVITFPLSYIETKDTPSLVQTSLDIFFSRIFHCFVISVCLNGYILHVRKLPRLFDEPFLEIVTSFIPSKINYNHNKYYI